jgi:hypothetical protein
MNRLINQLSGLEIISLSVNIILLIIFFVYYKIGKFSNEFIEAKTIENNKIHYRIETYKTKLNEWLYKVVDKDKDKIIKKSKKFTSKLNLDREILRTYENADQVIGVGITESNELHEEIVAP